MKNRLFTAVSQGFGRDEATRTPDPYVPNVVRYQLRYIPLAFSKAVQRYVKNLKRVHDWRFFFKKVAFQGFFAPSRGLAPGWRGRDYCGVTVTVVVAGAGVFPSKARVICWTRSS